MIPFDIIGNDVCVSCEGTLRYYNKYGRPVYITITEKNAEDIKQEIHHMQCIKCGRKYNIYWEDFLLPRPILTHIEVDNFVYKFINGGK